MPLLWAHAEFLKLLIARERRPIELLQVVDALPAAGHAYAARVRPWHWRDEVPVISTKPDANC